MSQCCRVGNGRGPWTCPDSVIFLFFMKSEFKCWLKSRLSMVLFLAAKGLRGPLVLEFCGLVMTGDE